MELCSPHCENAVEAAPNTPHLCLINLCPTHCSHAKPEPRSYMYLCPYVSVDSVVVVQSEGRARATKISPYGSEANCHQVGNPASRPAFLLAMHSCSADRESSAALHMRARLSICNTHTAINMQYTRTAISMHYLPTHTDHHSYPTRKEEEERRGVISAAGMDSSINVCTLYILSCVRAGGWAGGHVYV